MFRCSAPLTLQGAHHRAAHGTPHRSAGIELVARRRPSVRLHMTVLSRRALVRQDEYTPHNN